MSAPLLLTKLLIPPNRQNLVQRSRLLQKLDDGLRPGCRVVLISAPAGYGKTTLLSAWTHHLCLSSKQQSARVAWISLNSEDNDLLLFWSYVLASFRQQDASLGRQTQALLQSSPPPKFETFLLPLLNDFSTSRQMNILALDDFHLIHAPVIMQSLSYFIERAPSQFRLVIATRSDPPLPLARLRARDQILELQLTDLRFSTHEAGSFLNNCMGLHLSGDAVSGLNSKAEGWAAGLQMAAVSLRDQGDIEKFIASFSGSNRYILDYLIEEVLQRQSEEIQDFLMKTCILDSMCSSLCETVLTEKKQNDPSTAQSMLEHLVSSNMFIIPLDEEKMWYRYHQLFADLLRKRMEGVDQELSTLLHERASFWYEDNGMLDQAIEHAFLANNIERAAYLIDHSADEMLWRGEYSWLLKWIQKLPEANIEGHLRLLLIKAAIQASNGNLIEAENTLQCIEAYHQTPEQAVVFNEWYWGRAASVRALIAFYRGDAKAAIGYAYQGLEILPEGLDSPWRTSILIVLGSVKLEQGEAAAACPILRQAIAGGRYVKHAMLTLEPTAHLALALWMQGKLKQASQACRDGLSFIKQHAMEQAPPANKLYVNWGFLLTEQHRLDEASEFIRRGMELCLHGSHRWALEWAYSMWVRCLIARGELDAAIEAIHESENLERAQDTPTWITGANDGLKAQVLVRLGRLDEAESCLFDQGITLQSKILQFHPLQFHALSYLLMERSEFEQAAELAQRMADSYHADRQVSWWMKTQVLRSLIYMAGGEKEQALHVFCEVLPLAEEQAYHQVILDESRLIKPLLHLALDGGIRTDYVSWLLQESEDHHTPARNEHSNHLTDTVITLSVRELDVLRLVADGLANKEIAQRLFLSLRTVKYHTGNIYRKLGVRSRSQAINKARTSGIVFHEQIKPDLENTV